VNPPSDLRVWILAGVVGVLLTAVGYLLSREFARKDALGDDLKVITARFGASVDELGKAVAALALSVEELRGWSIAQFIPRPEHREDLEALKREIEAHASRFEKELEKCEARCPEKCGRP
jgi:hypothetical protein